jgi:RNA polymerase sigma-70 factor (TIGR02960 family)
MRGCRGDPDEPAPRIEPAWHGPCPDALLEDVPDGSPGPDARYGARESLALAFVAGLQHLPPRQRAALVLRDVLGFRAAEVAGLLGTSETAVNSALQRARAAFSALLPAGGRERAPSPCSRRERELTGRFVDAFESADVDRVVALLTDDARLTMPPEPQEYQGRTAIAAFYLSRSWWGVQPARLVPRRANGQPAFGHYLRDPQAQMARADGLLVLTLEGDRISAITCFGDSSLFPLFDLPLCLPG